MKVLLLTSKNYAILYKEFYVGLHKQIGSMDIRRLGDEQMNLRAYFSDYVNLNQYDRIFIHLEFAVISQQLRFLKLIDNLVFYDTTVYPGYDGKHDTVTTRARFYQKMPWARIIVSNYQAMINFQHEGLDAWCVPKGFSSHYCHKSVPEARDIPLLLLTNTTDSPSDDSHNIEATLKQHYPDIKTENTDISVDDSLLKQTKTIICADVARGEYGRHIFRSMATGCLVVCYDQGDEENRYLSLQDMENVVLFEHTDALFEKLDLLNKRPTLKDFIRRNGQALAMRNHQDSTLGRKAAHYIVASLRNCQDYHIGISAFGMKL